MPDEACDGRNVALIDKCFMVCSIVQKKDRAAEYLHVQGEGMLSLHNHKNDKGCRPHPSDSVVHPSCLLPV